MQLTYIGHQSWLIEDADAALLIDPVLVDSFGSGPQARFSVYPFRSVDIQRLPKLSGVALTTEHIQHFNLRSFALLDRRTPVLVGALFAESAVAALKELGFSVTRTLNHQKNELGGGLSVEFLPAGPATSVWDKRTNSLLIEGTRSGRSVVVQSDVAPDDTLSALGERKRADAVICTNNSQLPIWPKRGAWCNQLPVKDERLQGAAGVRLASSVLSTMARGFLSFPLLVINGNGHQNAEHFHGPFLWESDELAACANALSLRQKVWGPKPGERLALGGHDVATASGWVALDEAANEARHEAVLRSEPGDVRPLCPELEVDWESLRKNLDALIAPLLMSKLGQALVAREEYRGEPLGEERLVMRLRRGPPGNSASKERFLVLNVPRACWVERELKPGALLRSYPFGMDFYASDVAALFAGRLQAWELCSCSFRQWFLGAPVESPTAFLYAYFDEANRSDLSAKNYAYQLAQL